MPQEFMVYGSFVSHKRAGSQPLREVGENRSRFIDLSHTIMEGLIRYKGIPAPLICDYMSREASKQFYDEGTSFQIGKIEMVANTGTYLDSPFHRFQEGEDISELDLSGLAELEGVVVRAEGVSGRAVDRQIFLPIDVRGKAVLVHTGWAKHWATDRYFEGHSFLTEAAASYLREQGAMLVGIDSLNIDDTSGGARPVHTTLLGAGIPIVEHLCNLPQLPVAGFTFTAVPVKVGGFVNGLGRFAGRRRLDGSPCLDCCLRLYFVGTGKRQQWKLSVAQHSWQPAAAHQCRLAPCVAIVGRKSGLDRHCAECPDSTAERGAFLKRELIARMEIRPRAPVSVPLPASGRELRFYRESRTMTESVLSINGVGSRTFAVGGLSMGGQIVLEMYRQAPERIETLLLADTFAGLDTAERKQLRFTTANRLERDGMAAYAREELPKMITPANAEQFPDVAAHVMEIMMTTPPGGAAAALRGRAERIDYTSMLREIRVPTLVVVGGDDVHTPVVLAEQLHEGISGSRLAIIENAGHMPNLERAAEFNDVLEHFLSMYGRTGE